MTESNVKNKSTERKKIKMTKTNVAIIGGGIGGLMSAYQLKKNNPEIDVTIIELGFEL